MTNRSANATIKGYFYQFDHTIVKLLEAVAPQSSVIIEGIEDIDLSDDIENTLIQCKYYEGSGYNHSIIKDAIIQMFRHFHAGGCAAGQTLRYQLYGHYKDGQKKLPDDFDVDFLKKNFLTYKHDKETHIVHDELGVSQTDINRFHELLDIDLNAPSYEEQQKKIISLLTSQIPGSDFDDAEVFYYPNAINVIQSLAVKSNIKERKITKSNFISRVNRKENIFSLWLQQKFGDDYYARLIKRKYFRFPSVKTPKSSRFFAIDMSNEFELSKACSLLIKIGRIFSHVEHLRTPSSDRFCPYILLIGVNNQDLISLKGSLLDHGVKFIDGYPFQGAEFRPELLAIEPTKENLIKLKFIPSPEQLIPIASKITGSSIEIYDFFKQIPLEAQSLPKGVPHHGIRINQTYFIGEVL
ncbi:DUF4297 family anti-phage-associated protein [Pseudomonas syringae]|uniref:DUF4297 family anti-phage-associated protein n=1 Tax=Pseudomonas syringae TaxID=317 RepID=UPI000E31DF55|nr:DUF4297 family anti-phage-associated protein [Pseudomonas syringae]